MRQADAAFALAKWQHFSAWNDVIAAILNVLRHIRNQLQQSIRIYLKNNSAEFHPPDRIWNDRWALGFLKTIAPTIKKKNKNKMSSDNGSEVPGEEFTHNTIAYK